MEPKTLSKSVIYSVFVRNHTKEGTFRALEADLTRLHEMGADILWLMPVHPIGEVNRKGTLGSPYAISDYRAINPELGTMADFCHLVDAIHAHGMKCIIDVVYNHTSPDSFLADTHPEYFYRDEQGHPSRKVADWTDVVDLDYSARAMWEYQIETLRMWAQIVDGFRCDVASTVPVAFWKEAHRAVEAVRPGAIWLAESVHAAHVRGMWRQNAYAATDNELYEAFDLTYDYDIWPYFEGVFSGENSLKEYLDFVTFQETAYPRSHLKLRCLENHDQVRFASRVKDDGQLLNWLAFLYFEKGTTLLYSGMEYAPCHRVDLFEKDHAYGDMRIDLQHTLRHLKDVKTKLPTDGIFTARVQKSGLAVAGYDGPNGQARGIFSLDGSRGEVDLDLPDGAYCNQWNNEMISVENGKTFFTGNPIIIC
jgi:glycosidase